jgi:mevalonate kinase
MHLQIPLSPERLYKMALEAENMQHGRSSGLDLRIALYGGCIYMHGEKLENRTIPDMPLYLVNTGTPESNTGQCIEKVAPHFTSLALREDFAVVTQSMDAAIKRQSFSALQQSVRDNHRLLVNIGVVPDKVQQFIQAVEASNAAAKICGAGAVLGDKAGAVLVAAQDKVMVSTLCLKYGYSLLPIAGVTRGVYAA